MDNISSIDSRWPIYIYLKKNKLLVLILKEMYSNGLGKTKRKMGDNLNLGILIILYPHMVNIDKMWSK